MLTSLLLKNIKCLVQTEEVPELKKCGSEMAELSVIYDAFVFIKDGVITDFGTMEDLEKMEMIEPQSLETIDASGRFVFPSYCDSHTHLVYAGSREIEYTDKIRGLSYSEIAKRGGGILNSAKKLHETSEEDLYSQSNRRIEEIISYGTGAVEIKSGYGLNLADELKMLRVIRRIKESSLIEVKSTFLGAHAIPAEYENRRAKYVDTIINEMIPVIVAEELADYIDVFCDKGFFDVEDTERILMAGLKHGLIAKLHANELAFSGGIQTGVKYNALSVDHLEFTGDAEIDVLNGSETMPTLLPGSVFFLGMPDPPVRKMIDAGLPVALASDYNLSLIHISEPTR